MPCVQYSTVQRPYPEPLPRTSEPTFPIRVGRQIAGRLICSWGPCRITRRIFWRTNQPIYLRSARITQGNRKRLQLTAIPRYRLSFPTPTESSEDLLCSRAIIGTASWEVGDYPILHAALQFDADPLRYLIPDPTIRCNLEHPPVLLIPWPHTSHEPIIVHPFDEDHASGHCDPLARLSPAPLPEVPLVLSSIAW